MRKTCAGAQCPVKSTAGAAGYDLFSIETICIEPLGRFAVDTGVQCEIPVGCFGYVCGRSGLALNKGLMIGGGIIDSDYRGNLKVIVVNMSNEELRIEYGMKVAQMICIPCVSLEIEEKQCLSETKRGMEGFGSTGM